MRVRDVMSSPVVCVPPDMRLKEVADLLVTRAISAVPVVEDGELVGIVSEADLVPLELAPDPRAHLIPPADTPLRLPKVAAEAMTRAVVALPEDPDAAEAGRLMLERRIRSIPIVRGRWVVGIVARRDLLEVLARRDQDIGRELEGLLAAELGESSPYRVTVRDGIVRLTGPADPASRRLAAGPRGAGGSRGPLRRGVRRWPRSGGSGLVVPAVGYSQRQVEELAATINAADCDVVVASTPIGLGGCSASAVRSAL